MVKPDMSISPTPFPSSSVNSLAVSSIRDFMSLSNSFTYHGRPEVSLDDMGMLCSQYDFPLSHNENSTSRGSPLEPMSNSALSRSEGRTSRLMLVESVFSESNNSSGTAILWMTMSTDRANSTVTPLVRGRLANDTFPTSMSTSM